MKPWVKQKDHFKVQDSCVSLESDTVDLRLTTYTPQFKASLTQHIFLAQVSKIIVTDCPTKSFHYNLVIWYKLPSYHVCIWFHFNINGTEKLEKQD